MHANDACSHDWTLPRRAVSSHWLTFIDGGRYRWRKTKVQSLMVRYTVKTNRMKNPFPETSKLGKKENKDLFCARQRKAAKVVRSRYSVQHVLGSNPVSHHFFSSFFRSQQPHKHELSITVDWALYCCTSPTPRSGLSRPFLRRRCNMVLYQGQTRADHARLHFGLQIITARAVWGCWVVAFAVVNGPSFGHVVWVFHGLLPGRNEKRKKSWLGMQIWQWRGGNECGNYGFKVCWS